MILLVVCLFTAGCWDARELQERSFVLAAAIDKVDEGEQGPKDKERQAETFVQLHGDKKYRLSLQVLKLGGGGGGDEAGRKKDDSRTFILSNTGNSLFEMVRDMLGQSSKGLFFEHFQTLVISEAALKESGLLPIMDFFRRDPEMRWRIRVIVTPGNARSILEFKPPTGEPGGIFLASILRNHGRNFHVPGSRTDIGYLTQNLDNNRDFVLPRIVKEGGVLKVGGAAVFKKDKFVGYIDEKAVAGTKFIFGTERSGIITLPCKEHPDDILAFELFSHETKLSAHTEGENIYFVLDIVMRGNLGEVTCGADHQETLSENYIREAEVAFADEVKRQILYSHQISQKMGADYNQLGSKLKATKPKVWEKVRDNWDEVFPTVPLVVSVNVTIQGIGEHK